QLNRRIAHKCLGCVPSALRRGDVARAVLRLPGEALTQRVPADLIAEALDRRALARFPGAFAELYDARAQAAPQCAQQKTERRRRFALALAGVNDQQPLRKRL